MRTDSAIFVSYVSRDHSKFIRQQQFVFHNIGLAMHLNKMNPKWTPERSINTYTNQHLRLQNCCSLAFEMQKKHVNGKRDM